MCGRPKAEPQNLFGGPTYRRIRCRGRFSATLRRQATNVAAGSAPAGRGGRLFGGLVVPARSVVLTRDLSAAACDSRDFRIASPAWRTVRAACSLRGTWPRIELSDPQSARPFVGGYGHPRPRQPGPCQQVGLPATPPPHQTPTNHPDQTQAKTPADAQTQEPARPQTQPQKKQQEQAKAQEQQPNQAPAHHSPQPTDDHHQPQEPEQCSPAEPPPQHQPHPKEHHPKQHHPKEHHQPGLPATPLPHQTQANHPDQTQAKTKADGRSDAGTCSTTDAAREEEIGAGEGAGATTEPGPGTPLTTTDGRPPPASRTRAMFARRTSATASTPPEGAPPEAASPEGAPPTESPGHAATPPDTDEPPGPDTGEDAGGRSDAGTCSTTDAAPEEEIGAGEGAGATTEPGPGTPLTTTDGRPPPASRTRAMFARRTSATASTPPEGAPPEGASPEAAPPTGSPGHAATPPDTDEPPGPDTGEDAGGRSDAGTCSTTDAAPEEAGAGAARRCWGLLFFED